MIRVAHQFDTTITDLEGSTPTSVYGRGVGAEMQALGERADAAEKALDVMTDAVITMRMERDLERAAVRELTRQLHEVRHPFVYPLTVDCPECGATVHSYADAWHDGEHIHEVCQTCMSDLEIELVTSVWVRMDGDVGSARVDKSVMSWLVAPDGLQSHVESEEVVGVASLSGDAVEAMHRHGPRGNG